MVWWHTSAPYMQDKYVNMQHNYVNIRLIYVNMQHNCVNMRLIYVNMQHNYVNINKSHVNIIMLHVDILILHVGGRSMPPYNVLLYPLKI